MTPERNPQAGQPGTAPFLLEIGSEDLRRARSWASPSAR